MNIQGIRTFIHPVKDMAQAKALYSKSLQLLLDAGAQVQQDVKDVGGEN